MSSTTKLPVGWVEITLGEFMEFKNGVNADKGAYGQGTKFVNVMDIFKRNFLKEGDITGSVQISEKQLSEYSVVNGDILFNRTSETPEEIAFSAVYTGDEAITFGGFVIRGRQTEKFLLSEFSRYCFKSNRIRKEMIRRSQGKVRANIGQKDLNKIPIWIPTKDEQEKIAHILSTWDTAIEKTERLIDAKEKRFKWLLKRLVSDQQDNLAWHKASIDELFDIQTFASKSSVMTPDGKHVVVDMGSISRDGYLVETKKTDFADDFLGQGDLVMPKDDIGGGNIIGKVAVIKEDNQYVCGDHVYRLVSKTMNSPDFLRFTINSAPINRQLRAKANGTSQLGLGKRDVLKQKVKLPSLKEQKAITRMLNATEHEILLLKRVTEKCRSQKRGLMQKLLTGKLGIKL